MTKVPRLRVILSLDREDFPGLLTGSKTIHSKMSENAVLFPAANPSKDSDGTGEWSQMVTVCVH
ncbi:MAG: hypothetical protein WCI05_07855 [Myxococcales bacterium]